MHGMRKELRGRQECTDEILLFRFGWESDDRHASDYPTYADEEEDRHVVHITI